MRSQAIVYVDLAQIGVVGDLSQRNIILIERFALFLPPFFQRYSVNSDISFATHITVDSVENVRHRTILSVSIPIASCRTARISTVRCVLSVARCCDTGTLSSCSSYAKSSHDRLQADKSRRLMSAGICSGARALARAPLNVR